MVEPVRGGYTTFGEYEINFVYENGLTLDVRSTKDEDGSGQPLVPNGQRNGIRFEGTDGWIWVNRSQIEAHNRDRLRAPMSEGAGRLSKSNNHMENLETGHRSATLCHLRNIALRTGRSLSWNFEQEHFVGRNARVGHRLLARGVSKRCDYSYIS